MQVSATPEVKEGQVVLLETGVAGSLLEFSSCLFGVLPGTCWSVWQVETVCGWTSREYSCGTVLRLLRRKHQLGCE